MGEERSPAGADLEARIDGMITRLIRAFSVLLPDDVCRVVVEEATGIGFSQAGILLVDHEQQVLRPLPPVPDQLGPQEVDTTVAGRAFQLEKPVTVASGDEGGVAIWVPLVDGAERLGVLYLAAADASDDLVTRCQDVAGLVAELLVSKSKYGDALLVARRTQDMTLAAELRWSMLPPLTFTSEAVSVACVLEPAYEVAGDAFDYAVNDEVLHLAIFDAMGHGLEASRMANLAVASYRSCRRRKLDLLETFRTMDGALYEAFGEERFVTAQLGLLDARAGTLRWLSAGHHPPLLVRGGRVASELVSEAWLPLGLGDVPSKIAQVSLEPDDSLLFFTDGMVEAHSPGGERFGRERLVDLTRRALADRQTLAETVRRLVRSVRAHREGPLEDDATILFAHWHPPRDGAEG